MAREVTQKAISVKADVDTLQRVDTFLFNTPYPRNRFINRAMESQLWIEQLYLKLKWYQANGHSRQELMEAFRENRRIPWQLRELLGIGEADL